MQPVRDEHTRLLKKSLPLCPRTSPFVGNTRPWSPNPPDPSTPHTAVVGDDGIRKR